MRGKPQGQAAANGVIFFQNELKWLQPLPTLGPHGQICPKPKR